MLVTENLIKNTFAEVRLRKVIFWRHIRTFVLELNLHFSF